jgi:predicted nucleotidyltransferase
MLRAVKMYSRRLIDQGAQAIVLFGSWVRGDAYKESDVDIHVVGKGARYTLERYQGYLLSISWLTLRQHLKAFKDPSQVCGVIPAWRSAMIVYDPQEVARAIKREAELWKWDSLDEQANKWVAEEFTGYAEEIHRLVGSLRMGRRTSALIVRSVLGIRMAQILAVHHRIFYDTENHLWDLVSARMGKDWRRAQNVSLGEGGESFEETCKAALQLFILTANEIMSMLNPRQKAVVIHACEIAEHQQTSMKQERFSEPVLLLASEIHAQQHSLFIDQRFDFLFSARLDCISDL